MLITINFHPVSGNGIAVDQQYVRKDVTDDERSPDEIRELTALRFRAAADAMENNLTLMIPLFGEWMRARPEDANKVFDNYISAKVAEAKLPAVPGIGGLCYPWTRFDNDGQYIYGISTLDYVFELKKGILAAGGHPIDIAQNNVAAFRRLQVTADLRPRQVAFFNSIGRPDLLKNQRPQGQKPPSMGDGPR